MKLPQLRLQLGVVVVERPVFEDQVQGRSWNERRSLVDREEIVFILGASGHRARFVTPASLESGASVD